MLLGRNLALEQESLLPEQDAPNPPGCPQVPAVPEAHGKGDSPTARSKAVATPIWSEAQRCKGPRRGMFLL